jgi:hypothetical protein
MRLGHNMKLLGAQNLIILIYHQCLNNNECLENNTQGTNRLPNGTMQDNIQFIKILQNYSLHVNSSNA